MVGQRDATVRHTEMLPVSRFEIHQLLLSPARLADRIHAGGLDMPQYVGRSVERQMARVFERFDDPVSGSGQQLLQLLAGIVMQPFAGRSPDLPEIVGTERRKREVTSRPRGR